MKTVNWRKAIGKAVIPVERQWLHDIAAEVESEFGADMLIVNIGIFWGATMYCMRAGAPHARMVGIDIEYPQGKALNPWVRARVLIGDSGKLHKVVKGPVHLLFIDGDHSYKGVRADIRAWTPKIAPGGVVGFHDFKTEPAVAAKHAGIKKAVLEWEKGAGWELLGVIGSIRAYRRPRE